MWCVRDEISRIKVVAKLALAESMHVFLLRTSTYDREALRLIIDEKSCQNLAMWRESLLSRRELWGRFLSSVWCLTDVLCSFVHIM